MASTSSTTTTTTTTKQSLQTNPNRLSDLLKEQQEPFVLEIYLLERRCKRKFTNKTNKNSGQLSNIGRSLYDKLVSINRALKLKNSSFRHGTTKDKEGMELDRCSSATCSTLYNTCSESDTHQESKSSPAKNTAHETAPHRVVTQWRFIEENKQCSPVSVLEEIDFLQAIPVYNVRQEEVVSGSRIKVKKKVSEDTILSTSLWDMLFQSTGGKTKQQQGSELLFPRYYQYDNSKKALQQTRQLLFDCVAEVVESRNKKQQRKNGEKGLMGPEEIGKIICNNLKAWGKLSTAQTNINQLLRKDISGQISDEWGSFDTYKKDISTKIGDDILEETMGEIVRDLIC